MNANSNPSIACGTAFFTYEVPRHAGIIRSWRRLLCGLLVFCLSSFSVPAVAQPHTCGPGTVPEFGRWFLSHLGDFSSTHITDSIDPPDTGSGVSAVKLLIGVTAGATPDWSFVVRDNDYRVLVSMGPGDFPSNAPLSRWTSILKTNRVILDLVAPPGSDIRVSVAEGIAFPSVSKGRLFSIVNPEHPWQELYMENRFTVAKRAGDSVGMLVGAYRTASASTSWCCSGVLISADIFLTNWHCGGSTDLSMDEPEYWSDAVCASTTVDINWAKGAVSKKYRCLAVLEKNQELDFAAIRLGPVLGPDSGSGEPVRARLSGKSPKHGDDVFVVHHSQCMEKLVSAGCQVQSSSSKGWLDERLVVPADDKSEFTHNCNAETGASGAPVFDENGLLIGLHHVGAGAAPACSASTGVNGAVKIEKIFEFVNKKNKPLATELGIGLDK
jgi:Trypsin-like peptidase domain